MKKQLVGIALILFGIIVFLVGETFDIWVPIIDNVPWGAISLIIGIVGLWIVYKNMNDKEL